MNWTSEDLIPLEQLPDRLFRTRSGKMPHVLWGVPFSKKIFPGWKRQREPRSRETIETLFQMARGKVPKNQRWLRRAMLLQTLREGLSDETFPWGPFAALAIVRACPVLNEDLLSLIFETARGKVEESRRFSVVEEPWKALLWRGELALTLAYIFPQAEEGTLWKEQAKQIVHEILSTGLHEDGHLKTSILPISRILLASMLRMGWMFPEIFTPEAQKQRDAWIRNSLYLTRPDGSMVFTSPESACYNPELFVAALQCDASKEDKKLGVTILPNLKTTKKIPNIQLPPESIVSETSQRGILRQFWGGAGIFTRWDTLSTFMEFFLPQTPLLSGKWECSLYCKGVSLLPVGDWKMICWNTSPWAVYLELELPLMWGFKLQRQFCLTRREEIAFWADTVFQPKGKVQEGPLEYAMSIPLYPGLTWTDNADSLELKIAHPDGGKGTLLPLALPEWRTKLTPGEDFTVKDGKLQGRLRTSQPSLYFPIFLDFSQRRVHSSLTWRQLTVAEKLKKVDFSQASGFRIQIGEIQWLLYRSLAHPANRTILGHNLQSESMLGRFMSTGEVHPLVEILGYQEENR
ncbi:MAG: hypothetical protein Q4D62_05170 [Planctomycetia bacterium]|nr:hypothetical protein [Planctomycetia bacterium]